MLILTLNINVISTTFSSLNFNPIATCHEQYSAPTYKAYIRAWWQPCVEWNMLYSVNKHTVALWMVNNKPRTQNITVNDSKDDGNRFKQSNHMQQDATTVKNDVQKNMDPRGLVRINNVCKLNIYGWLLFSLNFVHLLVKFRQFFTLRIIIHIHKQRATYKCEV